MTKNKGQCTKSLSLQVTSCIIVALVKKGIVRFVDMEVYRDPYANESFEPCKGFELNDAQKSVVDEINVHFMNETISQMFYRLF